MHIIDTLRSSRSISLQQHGLKIEGFEVSDDWLIVVATSGRVIGLGSDELCDVKVFHRFTEGYVDLDTPVRAYMHRKEGLVITD